MLIYKIVFELNLYSVLSNLVIVFLPTNTEEIRCFLGINLIMGLTKKPSYRDYWSVNIQMRDPFISSSMLFRDHLTACCLIYYLNDNCLQPKQDEVGLASCISLTHSVKPSKNINLTNNKVFTSP